MKGERIERREGEEGERRVGREGEEGGNEGIIEREEGILVVL